jgi:hypothetical protein
MHERAKSWYLRAMMASGWSNGPGLRGYISQGKTKEEALENIREAIDLYIESLREDGLPIPRIDFKPKLFPLE